MPAWPGSVPSSPLVGTMRIETDDVTVSFKPDVGPILRRRRYTAVSRKYEFDLMLTQAELNTLDTFFETTCEDGVLSFTMDDPATGLSATWYWDMPFRRLPIHDATLWVVSLALTREPA